MNSIKFIYESPVIEVIEVDVEHGFANSQIPGTNNENYGTEQW